MAVFFVLLILTTFVVLLFSVTLKIRLVFDSDESEIDLAIDWMDPFLKAFITVKDAVPILRIQLFNHLILTREIKKRADGWIKKHGRVAIEQLRNLKDVHVDIFYGFEDPFATGIACGLLNFATQSIYIDSVNQKPEFMCSSDYIHLDGTAKANIGASIINILKSRKKN